MNRCRPATGMAASAALRAGAAVRAFALFASRASKTWVARTRDAPGPTNNNTAAATQMRGTLRTLITWHLPGNGSVAWCTSDRQTGGDQVCHRCRDRPSLANSSTAAPNITLKARQQFAPAAVGPATHRHQGPGSDGDFRRQSTSKSAARARARSRRPRRRGRKTTARSR